MTSKVFEHPFDLTKVRLQSQVLDKTARFSGPLDCLAQTWRKEGIRGLYRVRLALALVIVRMHGHLLLTALTGSPCSYCRSYGGECIVILVIH